MTGNFARLSAIALAVASVAGTLHAATEADVEKSFFPYKNGVPTAPGVTPGTVINKSNASSFEAVLDPALQRHLQEGAVEVTVGTTTSLGVNKSYVEATTQNVGKVKLGAKPGELNGYVGGRPFPEEPDAADPRAGEKLAWNYRYGINWGDGLAISPFYWQYRNMDSGKVERNILFNFYFLKYSHRVSQAPMPEITPNPSKLYRATYVNVQEPQDVKNTQLLIQRYEDDLKQDDAYLYLGFQRRVRRLSTGQTTDAFLGSDIMIEDFEGYNGRISDMNWKYKGTANMLMPYYNHNDMKLSDEYKEPDGYKYVSFGGQGGCFPNITWQLRKVYILESSPLDPNHPVSKRVHYMDAQTSAMSRTLVYDRKGDLWKIFMVGVSDPDFHLPKNKGSGIALFDSFSMIDVQAKHCTTGQFKGQHDPQMVPVNLFSVQNMRGGN
ncbi:DUF1329 domain-containing protein [Aromatoleum anaerobium]|uniref:DUF1329 domain-containing protein n=1 Tax=Aromatoleum anaerobium TaxID=182180 RepID=A0ABX1PJ88_9RHOO|nr:DUF1329 domain-containing protein [Aromatoleum anaerobium]MCK0506659.1 DUF1329 domain-containing protein [Aromatoleum anaerobium]